MQARLTIILLSIAVGAGCERPAARPHVILVTSDTLRADHLSIHGYGRETSPHIDAFARAAWHFEDAVTVIPKTSPSFVTMFSGRHPREHGVAHNVPPLPAGLPLLAERLEAAGYRTAALVSNPVLRESLGFGRGFGVYRMFAGRRGSEKVNRAFLEWAESPWQQPTFVWLHYIDPHGPYTPPPEFEQLFQDDEWGRTGRRVPLLPADGPASNKVLGSLPAYQRLGDEDRVDVYVARYDAEIRYVDSLFGEVIDFLRRQGLYDESVVVFTSDHGESLGEHDYFFEHGWFAYDATLRVPLMIKTPGQREGEIVGAQVSLLDVLPTILALTRLPVEAGTPGTDLLDARAARGPVLVESSDNYPEKFFGVRASGWKYLVRGGDGVEQLYDLRADPGEVKDLSRDEPETMKSMRARYRELRDAVPRGAEPGSEGAPALDPETRKQLEALGYVP